jgi:hypothetical protein
MSNPTKTPGAGEELPSEPRYAAAEPQPQSAISERDALAEREDGTIRGGTAQSDFSGPGMADAVPIIKLTPDEQPGLAS